MSGTKYGSRERDVTIRSVAEQDNLILQWRWLPLYVAKQMRRRCYRQTMQELEAAGMLGLIRAAEVFDPTLGSFTTIAVYWIRQSMHRAEIDCLPIHIPCRFMFKAGQEGICEESLQKVKVAISVRPLPIDLLGEEVEIEIEEDSHEGQKLKRVIECLSVRDRWLLSLRYDKGLTLDAISKMRKPVVTRERIRQLLSNILHKLRSMMDNMDMLVKSKV